MTTNKKMGSKLANSVRQAKEQQTQETPSTPPRQQTTPAARVEKETTVYFKPSKRVWPD